MIIKGKYRIARRLGAPIFEKTQTQKFALSSQRKLKAKKQGKPKQKTDYGMQFNEKQKARFTYIVNERQFNNYVTEALAEKGKSTQILFEKLELRLDNVIARLGIAKTRLHARQIVSHGHIKVNGRKVDVPSYHLRVGDKISIRQGSLSKALFANLTERLAETKSPSWIKFNVEKNEGEVLGMPKLEGEELMFNLGAVIEFYSR